MRRCALWRPIFAATLTGAASVVYAQPAAPRAPQPALSGCHTAQGGVDFDFEGASRSTCTIEDARTLSILIAPEHLPPINPSPWYAFRYHVTDGHRLTVHVRYLGVPHRYAPKWRGSGDPAGVAVTVAPDGRAVTITLPPGRGVVSAQPLLTGADNDVLLRRLRAVGKGRVVTLGRSHDGRPVTAVRLGDTNAPHLVVLLGRQHPPEVTGAMAMEAFALAIARQVGTGAIDQRKFQFLVVPMLNPDGVARGHWRANLGGVDLNRDWGTFRQPETRAVADWLVRLPATIRPVAMLDFHSTNRNLFYVQGNGATPPEKRFLAAWLGGKETAFAGYSFEIEPRDANPGADTAKNWFNKTYRIPAYTYEVADDTDSAALRSTAEAFAKTMIPALCAADAPRLGCR